MLPPMPKTAPVGDLILVLTDAEFVVFMLSLDFGFPGVCTEAADSERTLRRIVNKLYLLHFSLYLILGCQISEFAG
jgi:hypothetical protein